MAQATQLALSGRESGSLKRCTYCNGRLKRIDGTDPDHCEELGGFTETFECQNCTMTGKYKYRYADGKERFTGACAGEYAR